MNPTLTKITATTTGFTLWINHPTHTPTQNIITYAHNQIRARKVWKQAPQKIQDTAQKCGILYDSIQTTNNNTSQECSAVTFIYNTSDRAPHT